MKTIALKCFCLVFFLFSFSFVSSAVGVGVSPSRINLEVEAGKVQELEFLVFNIGDKPIDIYLKAEGDISQFTIVDPVTLTIEPEPTPHELPIKNGKTFKVEFVPKKSMSGKSYSGTIVAIGSSGSASQFGGNVGVASQVNIAVVSPVEKSSVSASMVMAIVAGLVIIFLIGFLLIKKKNSAGKRR
jgi:hypothetical protein